MSKGPKGKTFAYYLPYGVVERLENAASQDGRSVSNFLARIIDQALPACPACDGPTVKREGVHYCESCNMSVAVAQ